MERTAILTAHFFVLLFLSFPSVANCVRSTDYMRLPSSFFQFSVKSRIHFGFDSATSIPRTGMYQPAAFFSTPESSHGLDIGSE